MAKPCSGYFISHPQFFVPRNGWFLFPSPHEGSAGDFPGELEKSRAAEEVL